MRVRVRVLIRNVLLMSCAQMKKVEQDAPQQAPTYRRSRSFVLPAAVKGADILQALKELADAEDLDLSTSSGGALHHRMSTSESSGTDDEPSRSLSPRSSSPYGGFLTVSPRGSASSPPTSSSPTTSSSSSSSSSSSRRHHFLTFSRRKGREQHANSSREEEQEVAAEAGGVDKDKGSKDESSSGKRVARTKSLRMQFMPWSKEEMDKARDERKKGGKAVKGGNNESLLGSEGNKNRSSPVRRSVDSGVPPQRRQSMADRTEAYGDYHHAEEARWDGFAKEASLVDAVRHLSHTHHTPRTQH
jgi:hypothetical protein